MTLRLNPRGSAVLAAFSAVALSCIATAQVYQGPIDPVPATYFGMHFHNLDAGTPWPSGAGIGAWRLWDARVTWKDIEPKPGQRDFGKLDRHVAMARLARAEVTIPFGVTPTWASARPAEKGPYGPGSAAEAADLQVWESYIDSVVQRYVGRVRTYELWNEVNAGTGFFSGTPAAMLRLQRTAYERVKRADPEATFVSPSGVGVAPHQIKWFDDYMAQGAGRYADVISYHFYQPRMQPEALLALVRQIREILDKHGVRKPLWNTESGYRMDLGQGDKAVATDPTWPKLDEETGAQFTSRVLILGWLAGLGRFYWYAWDNSEMGYIRPDKTLTQGAAAYGRTARWLTGAVLSRCERRDTLWRCDLRRGNAGASIFWRESGTASVDARALRGLACRENAEGASEPLTQDLAVGPMPVIATDCNPQWNAAQR